MRGKERRRKGEEEGERVRRTGLIGRRRKGIHTSEKDVLPMTRIYVTYICVYVHICSHTLKTHSQHAHTHAHIQTHT